VFAERNVLCSSSCAGVKALPASSLRTTSWTSAEWSASAASAAPGRRTGAPSSAPTTTRAVRRARSITAIAIDSAYSPVLRTTLQRPQHSVAARRGTSTASISSAGPRAVE
jgi:hypothetical protein